MGWTADFETGVCELLAAVGAGTYTPDAVIAPGSTGVISRGTLPPEAATGVGVRAYNLQPDAALADVVQPVQLWIRGDDAYVRDTADLVFDHLEGAVNVLIGTQRCPMVDLYSDADMGVDETGQYQRAVNYYFTANRPTPGRPD